MGHAILSPSAAHRWLQCLGSPILAAEAPDESSEYADEGTAAHELAAWSLREGRPAASYIGQVIPVLNDDGTIRRSFTVDESMASYVQVYVDSIQDKVIDGAQLEVETFVDTGIPGPEGSTVTGTSDAIVLHPMLGLIEVDDLKFGQGNREYAFYSVASPADGLGPVVEVNGQYFELNPQLALYALGALCEYNWLANFAQMRLTIHQPRLDHVSVAPEIDPQSLMEWGEWVGERADAITKFWLSQPTAQQLLEQGALNPSEKACKWCPAKAQTINGQLVTCPGLDKLSESFIDEFSDLSDLTKHGVASAMEQVNLLEQRIKAIREAAWSLAEKGQLPGWVIDQGRKGDRKWTDEETVTKLLRNRYRFKKADVFNEKLKTPTQLEKELAKTHPQRWEDIQEYITRGKPSLKLARVDEAKNPIDVNVAQEFGEVT